MTSFSDFRAAVTAVAPRAAVVFGSGLAGAADGHFAPVASIPYADVPGLVPPTVAGHGGRLAVGHWDGVPVVVCFGRVHFYEGHSWERVTALVRLVAEFGVTTLVLTNAAGGIREDLHPGDLMPIRGHLKLLDAGGWRGLGWESEPAVCPPLPAGEKSVAKQPGEGSSSSRTNPSPGTAAPFRPLPSGESWKTTALLWQHLALLESATGKPAGVYAALTGPCYETPAEIRALRAVGADAVGMSTAVEAETAAALGLAVVGVSCVTNKAAGLAAGTLSHHEVEAVARRAVGRLGDALSVVLTNL